jgi:hypothetical protein
VIELRFDESLYDGFAIDEATKTYAELASMDLSREAGAFVVRVTASASAAEAGIDEETLSAELANYALGLTIERSRAAEVAS